MNKLYRDPMESIWAPTTRACSYWQACHIQQPVGGAVLSRRANCIASVKTSKDQTILE